MVRCGGSFTDYKTTPTKVVLVCFGLLVGLWQYIRNAKRCRMNVRINLEERKETNIYEYLYQNILIHLNVQMFATHWPFWYYQSCFAYNRSSWELKSSLGVKRGADHMFINCFQQSSLSEQDSFI
jgi:hypothetical protein